MKYLVIALGLLFATPAAAQGPDCGTAAQAQALVDQYKEIPIMTFVDSNRNVIMIYANLDTGTVTVILSPIGQEVFCLISQGEQAKIGGPKRGKAPGPRPYPKPNEL